MIMSIGLTFPGSLQDESIICYVSKKFDVTLNIIEASFSTEAGWAILQIDGSEEEIKKVFEYLTSKKVKVQQIQINKK